MVIWKMASEQRTDSAKRIRLREVPPVIADRVTDPKRSASQGAGEEKWYHGRGLVFWCMDVQRRAGFFDVQGSVWKLAVLQRCCQRDETGKKFSMSDCIRMRYMQLARR